MFVMSDLHGLNRPYRDAQDKPACRARTCHTHVALLERAVIVIIIIMIITGINTIMSTAIWCASGHKTPCCDASWLEHFFCVCAGEKVRHVMDLVFGPEAAAHAESKEELWYHPLVRWSLAALLHRSAQSCSWKGLQFGIQSASESDLESGNES